MVEDNDGTPGIGTCFHIGENVFITARHVVENRRITKIATTNVGIKGEEGKYYATCTAGEAATVEEPKFHPNPNYDLAALRLKGLHCPQIPFVQSLEDRFENRFLLHSVVVMGFPPIPGSRAPILVCSRGEVSASFTTYFDDQRIYIVSCLARGGFSGGPALTPPHHCLGVVTRAVLTDPLPPELGFMAVVGPLPITQRPNDPITQCAPLTCRSSPIRLTSSSQARRPRYWTLPSEGASATSEGIRFSYARLA